MATNRKCNHPQCNENSYFHKMVSIPTRWGYDMKWYCKNHLEYGNELRQSEMSRIFPDGKVEFWDLFAPSKDEKREIVKIISQPKKNPQVQSVSTRTLVYRRDGNKCLCCGTDKDLTLDHILPKSMGGRSGMDNLQTLCITCNGKKGNRIRDYRILKSA